jgi:hypothetical protein
MCFSYYSRNANIKAKLAEAKPEKRKAEKLRRKENAQKLYEAEKAGTLTPEQQSVLEARLHSKIIRARAKRRENRGDVPDWKGGVVIDLDFDHLMTDQVSLHGRKMLIGRKSNQWHHK